MTTKEWLNSYKWLMTKAIKLQQTIDSIVAQIGTGPTDDGQPKGTGLSDQTGRLASQLADETMKLEQILTDALDRLQEIQDVIFRVPDVIFMTLLYDRYVLRMQWADITDDLHYRNDQYVRGKLHSQALYAIEEVMTEDERERIRTAVRKGQHPEGRPADEPDAGGVPEAEDVCDVSL